MSDASTDGGCAVDITNGATPSGSGSMPSDQRGHRGVAGDRHLVDLRRVDAALAADLAGQLGQGRAGGLLQPAEGVLVHHRGADPGDHVAAERLLLVEHRGRPRAGCRCRRRAASRPRWWCRGRRRSRSGRPVVSPGSTSTRASSTTTAVTLKSASRSTVGEPAQHVQVGGQLEVVDGVGQPDQVGALVGERGLLELDVPLLQRRPQDHLPADADGGGLGAGGQRRHLDGEVAGGLHQAAEPPAVGDLLAGERADVVPGDRAPRRPRPGPCTCGRCRGRRRWSRSRCRSTTRRRRR